MCFNAPVSLFTYIFGMYFSYILYVKGFKAEALFYGWVIQMQLIEYFLWKNQPSCLVQARTKSGCSRTPHDDIITENNIFISKIGIFINHLEPIVLWLAILYFYGRLPNSINYIMILFCIFTFYYTKNAIESNEYTIVTPESEPYLHWKWNYENNHTYYYIYFLISLILLSLYGLQKGYVNASIIIISYTISYLIYEKKHAIGAMWCFAAAFAPLLLPILVNLSPN